MTYPFEDVEDPIERALEIAGWGQLDGAHHKTWVIDQICRALLGDRYEAWVAEYNSDPEYEWDPGIAP